MVERGVFYKQFDADVAGGGSGVVIPFRRPWEQTEQAQIEPQCINLMTELLQWGREAEARELGAIAPADLMYIRLGNVANLAFRNSDRESHVRMRNILRAYQTLALDAFSTDEVYVDFKDGIIGSYASIQRPYVEEKGVRLGGVTLSHDDALTLQWSLEQVGFSFDPGEGDICIPFTPIHNELQYRARFQPEITNPVTVELAYALAEVPIMQSMIIDFPGNHQSHTEGAS